MRTTFDRLRGFRVWAGDQELGTLDDLLFDDASFKIRYLVVDARRWFKGRRFYLTPEAIDDINYDAKLMIGYATRRDVENLPTDGDVEYVIKRARGDLGSLASQPAASAVPEESGEPEQLRRLLEWRLSSDSKLCSIKDVKGSQLLAFGGEDAGMRIAKVDDLTVNLSTWMLPYYVARASFPHLGTQLLIPTLLTWSVDNDYATVRILTDHELAVKAPPFESLEQLGGAFETKLLKYFYDAFLAAMGNKTLELIPSGALGLGEGEWQVDEDYEGEHADGSPTL